MSNNFSQFVAEDIKRNYYLMSDEVENFITMLRVLKQEHNVQINIVQNSDYKICLEAPDFIHNRIRSLFES
jgi:hypothetical protein